MRIELIKKWDNKGQVFHIGTVLNVFDTKAKELISDGIAKIYEGEYPPPAKRKTELFKPKNNRRQ